jgi:retron-type reverse transcriptase
VLTKLTTYGNRLPQGAPTSPSLCNLILAPMAQELFELADKNNLQFTQYVDDLTFSGSLESLVSVRPIAIKVIQKRGFKVNLRKLKMLRANQRMAITGLVVNKGLSVGRKYIREVQRDIFRNRSSAIVNGKIAFVRLVHKRRAKKLRVKADNR